MKLLVPFFSCDAAVESCLRNSMWLRETCLPCYPDRHGNALRVNGVYRFGCKNRCVGLEGPFSTWERILRRLCGACGRGAHVDCSGWCFCDCEFNR